VSSKWIWPAFSRPRNDASAFRASSSELKDRATIWLISASTDRFPLTIPRGT
jgi:hypothetical protein